MNTLPPIIPFVSVAWATVSILHYTITRNVIQSNVTYRMSQMVLAVDQQLSPELILQLPRQMLQRDFRPKESLVS